MGRGVITDSTKGVIRGVVPAPTQHRGEPPDRQDRGEELKIELRGPIKRELMTGIRILKPKQLIHVSNIPSHAIVPLNTSIPKKIPIKIKD